MFIGHYSQIKLVENLVYREALPHAFLFSGPSGVGKNTFACALAAWLNCEGKEKAFKDFLNKNCSCESCLRSFSAHSDIIYREGSLEIAEVRRIIKQANFSPQRGRYKVIIVNGIEKLQASSANTLLKTLEEPSATTIFILITENLSRLIDTIKSRCFILKFFYVQNTVIEKNFDTRKIKNLKSHWEGRPALTKKFLDDKNYYKLVLEVRGECDLFLNGTLYDRFKISEKYAKINDTSLDLPQKLVIWLEYIGELNFKTRKGLQKSIVLNNLLSLHKLIISTNSNVQVLFNNLALTLKV